MVLDISKLKALGWQPKLSSDEAVRKTAQSLVREMQQG
jgi:nucleoside-diphosphate-sugar epimerase